MHERENGTGFWKEQVSFVLGKYYLLTVQEEPTRDCFQPVPDRILAISDVSGKNAIAQRLD